MPYAQINLAIDLFLIAVLSFCLLPRYPKFTIALFLLYLVPWVFPISPKKAKENPVPVQTAEAAKPRPAPTGQSPAYDIRSAVEVYNSTATPQEKLSKTQDLYRQIIGVLGAATGTAPATAGNRPGSRIDPAPNAPNSHSFDAFQEGRTGEAPTRLGTAMEDLKVNPDAAWFYLRLFWLAGAFTLWIQNYLVGILALIPNMIPIFYLARAVPLAYEKIKNEPWMKQASKVVSEDSAGQAWLVEYSAWVAAFFIAMPTFLIILLFWRQVRGVLSRGLRKFLRPELYQVRFNGHVFDFSKQGKDLVIEGLRFQANRMVQDRKRPEIWRLGSGTELEFIPRSKA